MTIITSVISALEEQWHYGRSSWALMLPLPTLVWRHAQTGQRASVKLVCVSGVGGVKGFSHPTDQPSTRCGLHKWVWTKESLWLSHSLLITLTLSPRQLSLRPLPQLWLYIRLTLFSHTQMQNTLRPSHTSWVALVWLRGPGSTYLKKREKKSSPLLGALCLSATLTEWLHRSTVFFISSTNGLSVSHQCTQPQHMSSCLLQTLHRG